MGRKVRSGLGRKLPHFIPNFILPAGSELTMMVQNRVTGHSAILDWVTGARRHLARLTPQAEPPYETEYIEE